MVYVLSRENILFAPFQWIWENTDLSLDRFSGIKRKYGKILRGL
jgi:hypothetical protein